MFCAGAMTALCIAPWVTGNPLTVVVNGNGVTVFFKVVVAYFNYAACSSSTLSGFKVTSPTGCQFLVSPDQRDGLFALAA